MTDFKVKFRGVRGSFPVANKNFMQYGGNTSCIEVNAGNRVIIFDAGTGIVAAGDDLMEQYIASSPSPDKREPINATIFISHIHQDHLLGLTFFKPLHLKSASLNVYGPGSEISNLEENLSLLVFGKTFPIDLGDIACQLNINNLQDDQSVLLKEDGSSSFVSADYIPRDEDVLISYYKSYIHPQEGVIIYKITYKGKSLVYATDKECFSGGDKKFIHFSRNCDLLIHDAQYTTEDYLNPYSPKQGFGHSTFDMAVESMKQTNAKNLVFYHYDPSYDDIKLNRISEHYVGSNKNIQLAYEGLEVDII